MPEGRTRRNGVQQDPPLKDQAWPARHACMRLCGLCPVRVTAHHKEASPIWGCLQHTQQVCQRSVREEMAGAQQDPPLYNQPCPARYAAMPARHARMRLCGVCHVRVTVHHTASSQICGCLQQTQQVCQRGIREDVRNNNIGTGA
jgi:hypothetical protein